MAVRNWHGLTAALNVASARDSLVVPAAFAGAALLSTWPLVRYFGSALPNDLADPLLNAWILAWDADRLLHGLHGFWQAPIFHPYPNTLAYSEHLLGIAVFTAPIQWLTGNPIAAYNAAFLGSFVLAGCGMFLLASSLTGSRAAGLIGGVAFAFLPYRADQISHIQVLMYGWMPVALWGLHDYFRTSRRSSLTVFAIAFLLLGLSNGYFFYLFAVPVVLVAGAEILVNLRNRPWILLDLAITVAVMLVVVAPVIMAYQDVREQQQLSRPRSEIVAYSADVWSYLDAPRNTLWSGLLAGDRQEVVLLPGFGLVSLAVLGLGTARGGTGGGTGGRYTDTAAERLRIAGIYGVVGAAGFVLSLGPEPSAGGTALMSSGPYDWLLRIVPGLDGLRVPARAAILVFLSLTVLAALGVRGLAARLSRTGVGAFCLASTCFLVAEGYHPVSMVAFESSPESRAVYRWLEERLPGAVLELPFYGHGRGGREEQAMRFVHGTLEHGNPLVNGYSGYRSPLHHLLAGRALQVYESYGLLLRGLRAIGVRYVVVHEERFADPEFAQSILATMLRETDQILNWRGFGRTVAIELVPWNAEWDELPRESPPATGLLTSSRFQIATTHAPDRLDAAVDSDFHSRWLSSRPQSGEERVRIQFDQPTDVAHVRLWMGPVSFLDYPRYLVIESSGDGRAFRELYRGRGFPRLLLGVLEGKPFAPMDFALPQNASRVIRLRQTGRDATFYWSIHEFELWERESTVGEVTTAQPARRRLQPITAGSRVAIERGELDIELAEDQTRPYDTGIGVPRQRGVAGSTR